VVWIDGRDSRVSDRRLCVKGRYGFDYATHPQRLTQPLIRREGSYPKGPLSSALRVKEGKRPGGLVDYAEVMPHFREASWDEALDLVARRLLEIRERHGSSALAGFGSAKGSNEEAYLFQKLVRVGFGTNNVDHCTRLCHASSVAALMETIGSGAVSTTFRDIENSDVAMLVGTNATPNSESQQARVRGHIRDRREARHRGTDDRLGGCVFAPAIPGADGPSSRRRAVGDLDRRRAPGPRRRSRRIARWPSRAWST
jgi:formate dehydrogenase major subunit